MKTTTTAQQVHSHPAMLMLFKTVLFVVFTASTHDTARAASARYGHQTRPRIYNNDGGGSSSNSATNSADRHITISGENDLASSGQGALLHYQAQNTDGYYKFGYANPDGQYRVEEGSPSEGVLGSYGYVGTDGNDVKVYYVAGVQGFRIITASLYKALLNQRARRLPEVPGNVEIEPFDPQEVEEISPEVDFSRPEVDPTDPGLEYYDDVDLAAKRRPEVKFINNDNNRPASFRFVHYRKPETEIKRRPSPTTTTSTTTTTTEKPTTTTTTNPTTTTTTLKPRDEPEVAHPDRFYGFPPITPVLMPQYQPYMGYNNVLQWRYPQQLPSSSLQVGGLADHGTAPPFSMFNHPQLGLLPVPASVPTRFSRLETSVQPPIVIKV